MPTDLNGKYHMSSSTWPAFVVIQSSITQSFIILSMPWPHGCGNLLLMKESVDFIPQHPFQQYDHEIPVNYFDLV